MSNKLYWGFAALIILLVLFSVYLVFVNKGGENEPSEHVPESAKKTTSKTAKNKSVLASEQSDKQDTKEGISPMTIEEVSNQITLSSKEQGTESISDESYEKLEEELSQLSLKEIIPRLADMKAEHARKLIEEAEWFIELAEQEMWELSTEEQTALRVLERRIYPEDAKRYEERTGLKAPPPGYTYHMEDDQSPRLIKYNTPDVTIDPKGAQGYENWHNLTDAEYRRYLVLNAIANRNVGDLQISQEVAELAKEWKQSLYEKSWGYKPSISVNSIYTRKKTPEDEALEQKLVKEAEAKIQTLKPKTIPRYHDNDVKVVVNELKTSLNRR